jgi:hypothetical protein
MQSDIAIRVERNGKFQSLFLHELDYINGNEIMNLSNNMRIAVFDWFDNNPDYEWSIPIMRFIRRLGQ